MKDVFEVKGIWFAPGRPTEKIPGNISFSQETGVILKLQGMINHEAKSNDIPLINGVTENGKVITLYKCYRLQQSTNVTGFGASTSSTYDALYLFTGAHFASVDQLKFTEMKCQLEDFDKWLEIYGVTEADYKKDLKQGQVKYTQPQNHYFKVSDTLSIEFRFSTSFPYSKHSTKLIIEQICEIVFYTISEDQRFETLMEWASSFNHFITLAYFDLPVIKKITLGLRANSKEHGDYTEEIQVFYEMRKTEQGKKVKVSRHDFLFQYHTVENHFEKIISNWYKAVEVIDPCISGLVESFMNKNQVVEFKFLNLAHSIETFHRRIRYGNVYDSEIFKEKVSNIIQSVDEEHKDWLKGKLEFANEVNLNDRLEQLISEVPKEIQSRLFKPTIKKFIVKFKQSRNYYTHYDKRQEKKALKGSELFYLTERMKIFLLCLILKEVGFDESELEEIILKKSIFLFNHIIDRNEVMQLFYPPKQNSD